jgi:hypothetical protein
MKEKRLRAMTNYEELVELYTDYLIVVNGQATATGLLAILDNKSAMIDLPECLQVESSI